MRLLLIIPGAIGDFVLTLPSIAWIRQKLEPEWLEIWTERTNLELAQASASANQALALADTGVDCWPPREALFVRLKPFDVIVSWRGAQHGEWRELLERHHPNVRFLTGIPENCVSHAMDYRRIQVESLFEGDGNFPSYPEILPAEDDFRFAREYLAPEISLNLPIAIIHPGASGLRKRWPVASFGELIRRLAGFGWQTLLCEGPLDREPVQELSTLLQSLGISPPARCVRIERLMPLAAVIRLCTIFVGNDSGIAHLAAGTGSPTLAIFTSTDPAIWAPRGPRVEVLVRPEPDEVLATISWMKPV